MIDKELALRNVIANQALEGLKMTADEIAEIHRENRTRVVARRFRVW